MKEAKSLSKLQQEINSLDKRVADIEQRNRRVEVDKAWEISWHRRVAIVGLTYFVVLTYFWVINVSNPWLNAIVPTLGFYLSTLTLSLLKNYWVSKK